MKTTKTLSLFLAAVMLLLPLSSCGGGKGASGDGGSAGAAASTEAATSGKLTADLPDKNYNGDTFTILTFAEGTGGGGEWDFNDITPDPNKTGEVVNDAVVNRNLAIEEKYNIKIKEDHNPNSASALARAVQAGNRDYDLVSTRLRDCKAPILNGYFKDLAQCEYVNLDRPYYHQQSRDSMTFDGKLYIVLNDILLSGYDATTVFIFNRQMIQDYALEDPYALVEQGKWTVDKVHEMCKGLYKDLNNNNAPDNQDQWGFATMNDVMMSMLASGGCAIARKGPDGWPVPTFGEQRTYDVLDKATDFLYDGSCAINLQKDEFGGSSSAGANTIKMFTENRVAFAWVRVYLLQRLRDMEANFGVLPIPKIYEEDPNYYNSINVWHACGMSIPACAEEERSSIILEAMACESYNTVKPAYYETALKNKYVRDEEAARMIDFIFNNRVIDVGDIFNIGTAPDKFYNLYRTDDKNFSSFWATYSSWVDQDIAQFKTKYTALQ